MDAGLATKRLTYSLLLLVGGYAIAFTIISILINHIIEYYRLTGADQGLAISVMNIGNTVAVVLTLVMRWKIKKTTMLAVSGLISVAALALTGASASFAALLVICLVLGVGLGWTESYANSTVIDINRNDSAKYQGALHGWYGVGALLTPIAIQALLLKYNWQEVYLLLAPVVLLTVFVFMVTARRAQRHISVPRIEAPNFASGEMRKFLRNRRNVCLLLAMLTYSMMQFALFAWIVRYMSVEHGNESLGIASITLMWICTTISRFVASRLPIDLMKLHTYGSLITGVGLAIGVFSGNAILMCAMVGVSGLASGHCIPTLMNESVISHEGKSQLPTSAMILTTRVSGVTIPPALGLLSLISMQVSMLVPIITIFISALLGYAIIRLK